MKLNWIEKPSWIEQEDLNRSVVLTTDGDMPEKGAEVDLIVDPLTEDKSRTATYTVIETRHQIVRDRAGRITHCGIVYVKKNK